MAKYIRFFFLNKKEIKKMSSTFELLWIIWLVTTAIYLPIVLNIGNNIYFEKWNIYYLMAFVYVVPRFKDLEYVNSFISHSKLKVLLVLLSYNLIIISIEIATSLLLAKYNQCEIHSYWLGQIFFVAFWLGTIPSIYIKKIKWWITYEICLMFFIAIMVKTICGIL